jgi:hypothetical protein
MPKYKIEVCWENYDDCYETDCEDEGDVLEEMCVSGYLDMLCNGAIFDCKITRIDEDED